MNRDTVINFRITDEEAIMLKQLCEKKQLTKSQIHRKALVQYLQLNGKKTGNPIKNIDSFQCPKCKKLIDHLEDVFAVISICELRNFKKNYYSIHETCFNHLAGNEISFKLEGLYNTK